MLSELTRFQSPLQVIDQYPGWDRVGNFLEAIIDQGQFQRVADLGGGANPAISANFAQSHALEYCLVDISQDELDKAPSRYTRKICVDLTAPLQDFQSKVGSRNFDMVFSHMFLEHIANPVQAHANMHHLLRDGGIAVHLYPSSYNIPLAVNRLLPEFLTERLARMAQPERDFDGKVGKFPAFYRMCGNSSEKLRRTFEELGYSVLIHAGFVGHVYYRRIPLIRQLESALRPLLVSLRIPMTSAQLLVLQRNGAGMPASH